MKDNKIIGEIIEVSSRSAVAQSYELYDCPPIGSVVKCGDDAEDIYGVITILKQDLLILEEGLIQKVLVSQK